MKSFLLLATLTLSPVVYAQTPSVKWTASSSSFTDWIQLNQRLYPYYCDTTQFILFNPTNSGSLLQQFKVSFPTGFYTDYRPLGGGPYAPYVEAIPDISGDGKDDIEFVAITNSGQYNDFLLVDGASGNILYRLPFTNDLGIRLIGDVDGDGHNEILCQPSDTSWIVYATNGISTGVTEQAPNNPTSFQLRQNYPNPFSPSTIISYSLPTGGHVMLRVFDVLGREVKTLVDERQSAGNHQVPLSATGLASGVYFYQLQAGDKVQAKKLMVIK